MSTPVLDREEVVIEGVDLSSEIPCQHCKAVADWRVSMKCCGASVFKCDSCYSAWREDFRRHVATGMFLSVTCGHCRHVTYAPKNVDEIVRSNRIRGAS